MCACSPESKSYPGLQKKKCDQQLKGASVPLLYPHEIPPGVLDPTLGSSAQERQNLVQWVLREATKMPREQEHLSCEVPLRKGWRFSH